MALESEVQAAIDNTRAQHAPDGNIGVMASLSGNDSAVATFNAQLLFAEVKALQAGVLALAKALDNR